MACLNAQKKREEAGHLTKLTTQKANGLVKLVELLWRRVIGFEWLIGPHICPPRLTKTGAELVHLSKEWLWRDINDSMTDDCAASLDDEEVRNTGTYLGPRFPPRSWILIDQKRSGPDSAGYMSQQQYPEVIQQPRKEHTIRVIRDVLAQWTRTAEFLNVALSRAPIQTPLGTGYTTQSRVLDLNSVGQLKIYHGSGKTNRPTQEGPETDRCSDEARPSENDFF